MDKRIELALTVVPLMLLNLVPSVSCVRVCVCVCWVFYAGPMRTGACVKEQFAIGGSGSSYIYGYCDANYKPNMTRAEAIKFVTTGLVSR